MIRTVGLTFFTVALFLGPIYGHNILYGAAYLFNIMINGKGTWPDTNDRYGFLDRGSESV